MTFYVKTKAGTGRGQGTRQIRLTAKGNGIGNAVSVYEALSIQRAFVKKLRQGPLDFQGGLVDAEAVLQAIETAIAEEDAECKRLAAVEQAQEEYKKTLYKD